jgi:hypothetical protein
MLRGGCLCGAVRYEIEGPLGPVILCHCVQCRRASGTAFAANASVAGLRIVAGENRVNEFESSPGKLRASCRDCGSALYSAQDSRPGVRRVRLGTLDDDPGVKPAAHIWVGDKAPWFEIPDDGLQRFDAEPPPEYLAPG